MVDKIETMLNRLETMDISVAGRTVVDTEDA